MFYGTDRRSANSSPQGRLLAYGRRVRWDDLFTDLDVEADGLAQRERDAEIAERTRIELAALTVLDRLAAGTGTQVRLDVLGVGRLTGRLLRTAPQWLMLDAGGRSGWVVAVAAVTGIEGLSAAAAPAAAPLSATTTPAGWASIFRTLSRDRDVVSVLRLDGSVVRGMPVRVGRDFVEIWWRDEDAATGERAAPRHTLVPYLALAAVSVRMTEA